MGINKSELIAEMLEFHNLVKQGEDGRNRTVTRVWLEDLSLFSAEEIRLAWKRTRVRAKFFSLPELIQDLKAVHESNVEAKAIKQANFGFKCLSENLDTSGLDEITFEILQDSVFGCLKRPPIEKDLEEGLHKMFVRKYKEKANEAFKTKFPQVEEFDKPKHYLTEGQK